MKMALIFTLPQENKKPKTKNPKTIKMKKSQITTKFNRAKRLNNAFKSGDKILIQTSKDFIPATYIKKTTNAHQVKITKTMMGLRAGDIIEIGLKGIIPELRKQENKQ